MIRLPRNSECAQFHPDSEGGRIATACLAVALFLLAAASPLLFGNVHAAALQETSSQHPALVKLDTGCSGICVDPAGIIVTAKHCISRPGQTVEVRFSGGLACTATVAYVAPNSDLAVLRATERDLPFVPVAKVAPEVGEAVWSEGYPAGQYARMEGKVTFVGERMFGKRLLSRSPLLERFRVIETSHRIQKGNSGGPLFNRDSELVGIASMVPMSENDVCSIWMHTADIRASVAAAGGNLTAASGPGAGASEKPSLYVFVSPGCIPCTEAETDYGLKGSPRSPKLRQALDSAFRVQFVDFASRRDLTRKYGVDRTPTFVPTNANGNVVGYRGADWLLQELAPFMAQRFERSSEPILGEAEPFPDPISKAPETSLPGPSATTPDVPADPAPKPEVDYSAVTVIVLVHKEDLGAKGVVAGVLERQARGVLERKLNSLVSDKAEIRLVFERIDGERYTGLMDAAGLPESPVNVIALVEKRDLSGVFEGLAERIETALEGLKDARFSRAPVEVIFERTDPDHYLRIRDVLEGRIEDPPDAPADGGPLAWISGVLGTLFAGVKRKFSRG